VLGLLAAWLLFPAVALLVCLGFGLLAERAAGERLPGVLVLPVGMAGLVGATQLPTFWGFTAELTLPLVVVLALAGLWLGRRRERDPDLGAVLAFAAVFVLYALPVLFTGAPSFLGYTILGDTSIHMIGADALLTLGRDFDGLAPSSYEYSLVAYYGVNAYPSGGATAAGALTSLVGMDVAWTFQPLLSLMSALTALCLYSLATPLVPSRPMRATIAFLAAVPALSVAYAWQGSIKEVGTAFGVVLVAALIEPYLRERGGPARRAIPLGVAVGATVGIVGLAAMVWLGPLALGAFLLARLPWRHALVFAGVSAVLGYQMLLSLVTYVDIAGGVVTAQQEFGNLLGPLRLKQAFGVWLTGDYRVDVTEHRTLTNVLILVVAAAMLAGLVRVVRRRGWVLALFLGVSAVAFAFVVYRGSPWADGKALMIVSPAVMLAAGLGAAWLGRAGWAVLAVIGLGVMWSNALQYHDASPAPNARFSELQEIGDRIDGAGPTLYPEFEEFAKHFLRDGDPEGTGEGWQRRLDLAPGAFNRFGFATDLDFFTPEYVSYYRTIVLRRGFQSSRPPAAYERTFRGRFYDIWTRRDDRPAIARVPSGGLRRVAAPVDCAALKAAAARGPRLAFAERPPNLLFELANQPLQAGWSKDAVDPETVVVRGAGTVRGTITAERAGRYDVWAELADRRAWTITVDGKELEVDGSLNSRGSADPVGRIELTAGPHEVVVTRPRGSLAPGSGGHMRLVGPVAFTPVEDAVVGTLPADRYEELCGRSLDWVEAIR
jgi:hypothetical protein